MACWRLTDTGAVLLVKAQPGAARDEIAGVVDDAEGGRRLKVRVRAKPEDGKANAAIAALLAGALGLPKSAVSIEAGETSRSKRVRIVADASIASRLKDLTGDTDAG